MKKTLLSIALLTVFGLWTNAQTIENFESITMNIFSGGTNGAISVIANPDSSSANPSAYVAKMVRGFDGDPWAGWYATLPIPIDVTANKYVHVKLWKPRISPIVFKYEGDVNSGDVNPMNAQTLVNEWEEFVFDMSIVSGDYVKIVLIPDFENPLTLTEDIVIYYDDLYVNDDPTVGSAPVQLIEDFEIIPLNYLLGGADDMSYMELVPNPDPSGANLTPYCAHFLRDMDGVPWGGFWSNLPQEIDVTENKYVHVKVWKPRISPVKFKIEGGADGTIEVESMYPQTMTNAWEDMVFDFSEKTGTYPIIAFLPDFEDPLTLAEDINIYFDEIILNNDSTPIGGGGNITVTFSVNMSYQTTMGTFDPAVDFVDVAGTFNNWGDPAGDQLTAGADDVYSLAIDGFTVDDALEFKFRINGDWDTSEFPDGGPNRTHTVVEETNTISVWYNDELPPIEGGIIADFEDETWGVLTPHVLGSGEYDDDAIHPVDETFMVVDNPDPTTINTSSKVLKFIRRGTDVGGAPWGGFWASCTPNVDATDDKYVHVMVWKPMVSPIKFKLEGGPNGTLETESIHPQTITNGWQDMVFDFSTLTGGHPVVALLPDFQDPFETAGDVDMYIDNIVINGDPNPISGIWNNPAENEISMYPNPFTNSINIELANDMKSVVVSNTMGQQVFQLENIERGTINIEASDLRSGVYIITLTDTNNKQTSGKMMKN